MYTMYITTNSNNSLGTGWKIYTMDVGIDRYYYGYSLNDAIKLYRREFGLQGKHYRRIMY